MAANLNIEIEMNDSGNSSSSGDSSNSASSYGDSSDSASSYDDSNGSASSNGDSSDSASSRGEISDSASSNGDSSDSASSRAELSDSSSSRGELSDSVSSRGDSSDSASSRGAARDSSGDEPDDLAHHQPGPPEPPVEAEAPMAMDDSSSSSGAGSRPVPCCLDGDFAHLSIAAPEDEAAAASGPDGPLRVDPAEVKRGEMLGQGGFGSVHLGTYRGQRVVCKQFHARASDVVVQETYKRELTALRLDLNHAHVARVLGATCLSVWKDGATLLMAYAGDVTLEAVLNDPRNAVTVQHLTLFTTGVTEGLRYLHSRHLLHLDVKPANVIFSHEEQTVCLCDYGTCHVAGEPWKSHIMGTLPFRAPELFSDVYPRPAFSSDVYSLAVTMWCLDSRQFPHCHLTPRQIVFGSYANQLRPPVPETPDDAPHAALVRRFRDLYTACWAHDPAVRPTLDEVLKVIQGIAADSQQM